MKRAAALVLGVFSLQLVTACGKSSVYAGAAKAVAAAAGQVSILQTVGSTSGASTSPAASGGTTGQTSNSSPAQTPPASPVPNPPAAPPAPQIVNVLRYEHQFPNGIDRMSVIGIQTIPGYYENGIQYSVLSGPVENTIPIYRCFNLYGGNAFHFDSNADCERQGAFQPTRDFLLGYLYAGPGDTNRPPVYRCIKLHAGDVEWFSTLSPTCEYARGFVRQGVLGYAPNVGPVASPSPATVAMYRVRRFYIATFEMSVDYMTSYDFYEASAANWQGEVIAFAAVVPGVPSTHVLHRCVYNDGFGVKHFDSPEASCEATATFHPYADGITYYLYDAPGVQQRTPVIRCSRFNNTNNGIEWITTNAPACPGGFGFDKVLGYEAK